MASATPIKVTTGGGFSNFKTGDFLPIEFGGTGGTTQAEAQTALGILIGTNVQAFDADLSAIAALSGAGFAVRTGTNTWATRTLSAGDGISISNSDGAAANPTISMSGNYSGILTLSNGTITTGNTTALSLATIGGTQVKVFNIASAINYVGLSGGAIGNPAVVEVEGVDPNSSIVLRSKGTAAAIIGSTLANVMRVYGVSGGNRTLDITNSVGGVITIGTSAGSINLSPGGFVGLQINAVASQANYIVVSGTTTGGGIAEFYAQGADSNISVNYATKGSGAHNFYSNVGTAVLQMQITHTVSANRYVTITGSNGGNPTISTNAGLLSIARSLIVNNAITFASEYDNGNSGAAATITLTNGSKQKITLNNSTTLTVSTTGAGIGNYQIRLIQDGVGGRTVTWVGLSGSRWLGETSAPGINSAIAGETIVSIYFDGTNMVQSLAKVGAT